MLTVYVFTLIIGITDYRIKTARQHAVQHGRGVPLLSSRSPRMRVSRLQLDDFMQFITSPHIVQDLPFGQRKLQLSNGTIIETPNTIRSMVSERIANQYIQYCEETNFKPFSKSTMLRILSACTATVRKSLQGLDYIAAEGGKAFDDLISILEKIKEWIASCEDALKAGKQYLKTDYKVFINMLDCITSGFCSFKPRKRMLNVTGVDPEIY